MKNCKCARVPCPYAGLPSPETLPPYTAYPAPPTDEECFALWRKYEMRENIRRHSLLVAHIAETLAKLAAARGLPVNTAATRASGLLHDIAKTWCITHKGAHAMLGASWTGMETGHFGVAQGVLFHVHWPWTLPAGEKICCLPIFVLYADKRVRHDQCVTLEQRFDDLLERYGKTEDARRGILLSFEQARIIEAALSAQLEEDLHENTFDCGRLVQRA